MVNIRTATKGEWKLSCTSLQKKSKASSYWCTMTLLQPRLSLVMGFNSGDHHRFYPCFQKLHSHCHIVGNYQITNWPLLVMTLSREISLSDSENVWMPLMWRKFGATIREDQRLLREWLKQALSRDQRTCKCDQQWQTEIWFNKANRLANADRVGT